MNEPTQVHPLCNTYSNGAQERDHAARRPSEVLGLWDGRLVTGEATPGPMSSDMALSEIFQRALDVAERYGSTISVEARAVGPYEFMSTVRLCYPQAGLSSGDG